MAGCKSLFLAALDMDPGERGAFLADACQGDSVLRQRVEALLKAAEADDPLLDRQAAWHLQSLAGPIAGVTTNPQERAAVQSSHEQFPRPSIPGYEILGELGRGGMGVVWLARHLGLKRVVAIKVMLGGSLAGAMQRDRFRAETEAIARLQHPNIVQIFEVGEYEGHPYCALEHCSGGSLATRLAATPQAPIEAARITEVLARALRTAHDNGVVHRDIKPANVLFRSTEADAELKIADFGLAKQLDRETDETRSGMIMGSPGYMAPEQAAGRSREVGPAADIYSLGAILYEMLTGRPPFKAASVPETLRQVVENEPPSPRALNPAIPRDLETVCLKCLEKDPARRYGSASELAEDLRRFREGEPVRVRPVGPLERGRRWCVRNPALAFGWGAFIATLLLGIGATTVLAVIARSEADAASQAREYAEERSIAADAARTKAEENAQLAARNAAKVFDRAYPSELRKIQVAREKNQFASARDLLALQHPDQTDGTDRRGFEWWYWHRLLRNEPLVRIKGHGPGVNCVAFSPDGKYLATGLSRGGTYLYNALSGKEIRRFPEGGKLDCQTLAFSPNSQWLVTGGRDRVVRVWEVETGKIRFEMVRQRSPVLAVAGSPDGKWFANGGENGTVRLWDADTHKPGAMLKLLDRGDVTGLAFSPDGRCLAAVGAGPGGTALREWEVSTGNEGSAFQGGSVEDSLRCVAYLADGKRIATGDKAGRLLIHDRASGMIQRTLQAATGPLTGVAVSQDGKYLATSSGSGEWISVRDAATLQEVFAFEGQHVAFSANGKRLATVLDTGDLAIRDPATAIGVGILPAPQSTIAGITVSPDGGRLYASVDRGPARIWNPLTGEPIGSFGTPSTVSNAALAVHPGGRQAVLRLDAITLEVWDPVTSKRLRQLKAVFNVLPARVTYSPDGKTFAVAAEGSIQILSSADFSVVRMIRGKRRPSFGVAFDAGGKHIALRAGEAVQVWEIASGRLLAELPDPFTGRTGNPIAFSPSGEQVVSGNGAVVTVWDWKTNRIIRRMTGHTATVTGLAFSNDGKRLAACSLDSRVFVRDAATGEELLTLSGEKGGYTDVAFSPDGNHLYAAGADGVRVWSR